MQIYEFYNKSYENFFIYIKKFKFCFMKNWCQILNSFWQNLHNYCQKKSHLIFFFFFSKFEFVLGTCSKHVLKILNEKQENFI